MTSTCHMFHVLGPAENTSTTAVGHVNVDTPEKYGMVEQLGIIKMGYHFEKVH